MRIVEVTFTYPTEVFITRHILTLRDYGIEPVLIALDEISGSRSIPASMLDEKTDLGEVYVPIPSKNLIKKYASLRYLVKPHTRVSGRMRDKVLSSFFESLKPDLIHFHMGNLAGYLCNIPQSLHIPYTISLRGSDVQIIPFESKDRWGGIKKAIEGAAGIHSVCNALWETAIKTFEVSPINVYQKTIYTTIPHNRTIALSNRKDHKVFISVGRFHWTKSITFLLLAFSRFISTHKDAELILVGDGELQDCISYWVRYLKLENSVNLVGKKNPTEISELIKNSDAYIQSSIAEGLNNALAEAMMLGCPVFATDVGGTKEVIEDGINGFLLDPISHESWCEKFELVYSDLLMNSVREKAYQTACTTFSANRHAKEFIEFYQTAIHDSKE